ncbi:MAG: dihydrolipoyl dehydrogenase [Clostridiales bacterium]|nr:dihydrolipoyl dehydrogenase [Clostridiales bacterium]
MKIVILGGGPGGYVAAIRAAQLGAEVTLIEKNRLGGTCLNVGCVPTKVLLQTAEMIEQFKDSERFGITANDFSLNWGQLMSRKNDVVNKLVEGVEGLLISNGIKLINGYGKFENENSIIITSEDDKEETIEFDSAVIATGSAPIIVPIKGVEYEGVITSDEALSFNEVPEKMVIIGGGVIGIEFAEAYSSFNTNITLIEMADSILPTMDKEIGLIIKEKLSLKGIKIIENGRVSEIGKTNNLTVTVEFDGEKQYIDADKVLMAVGRKPVTDTIGLDKINIKTNRGKIIVDSKMRTNIKNIYAVGDCIGGIMLAHVASSEGIVAAETIMNMKSQIDFKTIPSAVYIKPEIASVGLSEEEAIRKGVKIKIGKFPLTANGKSQIMNEDGFVKIVADINTQEILGVQIVGPRATEIIGEAALAIRLEATVDELITTIHAHPTVSESLMEAANSVFNHAIHAHV